MVSRDQAAEGKVAPTLAPALVPALGHALAPVCLLFWLLLLRVDGNIICVFQGVVPDRGGSLQTVKILR